MGFFTGSTNKTTTPSNEEIELLLSDSHLQHTNSRLQAKVEKQKKEIARLEQINKARKEVIKQYARMRDEFRDYVLYTSAITDCYGHKEKATMGFDLRAVFQAPSVKKIIDELKHPRPYEDTNG